MNSVFDVKSTFIEYKDMLFKSKKYWLIYLLLIIIFGLSTAVNRNLMRSQFTFFTFVVVAVLGVFCIVFYFLHDSDEELHKVAFVVILCFGIVCALIVPICDVSDETEHLTRAEITSRGILIPHWTGEDLGVNSLFNHTAGVYSNQRNDGAGFHTISSIKFFTTYLGYTVFDTLHDTDKINHTPLLVESAFEQNPFFGYLPQALGIFIAKLLDLNVIWMLWLARLCNIIFYAAVISLAIRKTPVLKLPLLAVATIPISIYQSASVSIDCMIIALGILSVSYFIYMYQAEEKSITVKEIAIFTVICILLGLCKLTYLAFIFLLLLVPFKNYQKDTKNILPILLISFGAVAVIGFLWSKYSTPTLLHSWRASRNLVNSSLQIEYFMSNSTFRIDFFKTIFLRDVKHLANGVFSFFGARQVIDHYTDHYLLVTFPLLGYLATVLLFYPQKIKFELKTRLVTACLIVIIFVATCFIQLLTWAFIGQFNLGLSLRYFIPLFALIPIVFGGIKCIPIERKVFDKYAVVLMISFLAAMIVSFSFKYYYLF